MHRCKRRIFQDKIRNSTTSDYTRSYTTSSSRNFFPLVIFDVSFHVYIQQKNVQIYSAKKSDALFSTVPCYIVISVVSFVHGKRVCSKILVEKI